MDRWHREKTRAVDGAPIFGRGCSRVTSGALYEEGLRRRRAAGASDHSVPMLRRRNGHTATAIHA
jgi:hypothetical protein